MPSARIRSASSSRSCVTSPPCRVVQRPRPPAAASRPNTGGSPSAASTSRSARRIRRRAAGAPVVVAQEMERPVDHVEHPFMVRRMPPARRFPPGRVPADRQGAVEAGAPAGSESGNETTSVAKSWPSQARLSAPDLGVGHGLDVEAHRPPRAAARLTRRSVSRSAAARARGPDPAERPREASRGHPRPDDGTRVRPAGGARRRCPAGRATEASRSRRRQTARRPSPRPLARRRRRCAGPSGGG